MGGEEIRFDDDVAYHDHNWGRFQWGGDFGWIWGTILPPDTEMPWSLVFLQMTDRRRLHCLSQALYVWRHDEPAAIIRHAAVKVECNGLLGRAADCTLPPPTLLVLDGAVSGIPGSMRVAAERAGDTVLAEFQPQSYSTGWPNRVKFAWIDPWRLYETNGTARVTGSINGENIDFVGAGVFEFLNG